MNALLAALAAAEEQARPKISREGQLARLLEAAPRYVSDEVPFELGDVITPRADAAMSGAGEPHVVIAIRHAAPYHFATDMVGSNGFGARMNVRVLCFSPAGSICAYWVEAADFEPYTGEAA